MLLASLRLGEGNVGFGEKWVAVKFFFGFGIGVNRLSVVIGV